MAIACVACAGTSARTADTQSGTSAIGGAGTSAAGSAASEPRVAIEPRIARTWTAKSLTGAPVGLSGLVATPTGPVMLVGDEGGGDVELVALTAGAWKHDKLASGTTTARGELAAYEGRVGATALDIDTGSFTADVLYLARGSKPELAKRGCKHDSHELAMTSQGPVIVATCKDDVIVLDRTGAAWKQRLTWTSKNSLVREVAVDAADRIHVWLIQAGEDQHHVIDGSQRTRIALDGKDELRSLAACGGRIFATFYDKFGVLRGTRWELEPIETHGVLGFDEACRPFIASGDRVLSRNGAAWIESALPREVDGNIKGLVGFDGTLYAAYEAVRNGVSVGIATAPLEPP